MENKWFGIFIGILILAIILVNSTSSVSKPRIINADKDDITALLKKKETIVIDVRSADEYKTGHIEGAINIPYDQIESRANYNKKSDIIVYCQNGARSHVAAMLLQNMGFKRVYDMGGISEYDGKLTKD